jgi:ABC-2 type transport system permease protein
MISCSSVWAITLRHIYLLRHDANLVLASFYWPLLDVLVWGFLGAWVQSQTATFEHYTTTLLLGILLWQIIGRGSNVLINTLCEELWSNNIVNLFSLPLHIAEWICGVILFCFIMVSIITTFCMSFIALFFSVSIVELAQYFLLFMPPLVFCCIWVGFTCLQIIVTLGRSSVELGYVLGWLLMPFGGVYYPTEVLPSWAQNISSLLPLTYVFQGMRNYVIHQQDPSPYLIKAYILGILYAAAAVGLFIYCFRCSKQRGLARLSD